MTHFTKAKLHWAVKSVEEMGSRNSDLCDTFEGVLNRSYVRALKVLLELSRKSLRHTFKKRNEDLSRTRKMI
jgi:hypothetical protein